MIALVFFSELLEVMFINRQKSAATNPKSLQVFGDTHFICKVGGARLFIGEELISLSSLAIYRDYEDLTACLPASLSRIKQLWCRALRMHPSLIPTEVACLASEARVIDTAVS